MKTRLILDINKTQYAQLNSLVTGRVGDKVSNTVDVYVVDGFIPYNLTGSDVYFECAKPDNTSVRDKNGITMIDAVKGHFEYTFPTQTFASVGKSKQAYFTVEKNSTVKATTQDFIIVSLPDAMTNRIPSKTYISQLDELIKQLEEMQLDILNSEAYKEAHDAKEFAEQAKTLSESVKAQLDQIVIQGSIDPETKQARVDENGVAFPLLKDRIDNVGNRLFKIENKVNNTFVSVTEFGAIGNGTDETVKIQNAIDFAAVNKKVLVFPSGTYGVMSLVIKQGTVGVQSYGATLKSLGKAGEGIFSGSLSTSVSNYFIDGFTLDCDNKGRRGIFCKGSYIRISNNTIKGLDEAGVSDGGIRFHFGSSFNTVENNTVIQGMDLPFGKHGALVGIYFSGKSSNIYAGLDTNDDVVEPTEPCEYNTVKNNYVYGGTHGIHLAGAYHNHISENKIENQTHRSIILSPLASKNVINDNDCINFGSAGVHMAYGSSGNKVSDNRIYSDGNFQIGSSGGEGGIQAYIHCKDNHIIGNKIYTRSTRQGIYVAIHCSGTVIVDNDIDVNSRSGISVESDWEPSTSVYGVFLINPPVNPTWASWGNNRTCEDIVIKDNVIKRNRVGIVNCGIYVGQSLTTGFDRLTVDNNTVFSRNSSGHDFYFYVKDETKFNNVSIKYNTTLPLDTLGIKFSNLLIKLSEYKGNNWQDRLTTITDATITSLDFSVSGSVALPSNATISNIEGLLLDGNMIGSREFIIKLSNNVTIVNDSSKIRLKGNANAVGTNANQMITLRASSSILYEVARNF